MIGNSKLLKLQNLNSYLSTPIEYLKGVGPLRADLLKKELKIFTFEDMLMHIPYRYIDSGDLINIAHLHRNTQLDYVQIKGIIINFQTEGQGYKKRLTAQLVDPSGTLELIWFQGISAILNSITPNTPYLVFGKVTQFNGKPYISHPELEKIEQSTKINDRSLQPAYPTTEKLRAKGLHNRAFAKLTQAILEKLNAGLIEELIPNTIRQEFHLVQRYQAIKQIHFPSNFEQINEAKDYLKFEELLITQLRIVKLKLYNRKQPGWVFHSVGEKFNDFYKKCLPFELTNAQKRVLKEIRIHTGSGQHMNRLVQGDVGSGKTMVALMTMLLAIDNGFQASMMAPTEILATQHYESIKDLVKPIGVEVALLTGSVKGKARKKIFEGLAEGTLSIVIGTHALVEDKVVFKNLGVSIIDEQHRFGVMQRAKLWQKNTLPPHVLVMTATPIPRTLAMTVYGDLEVSVIDELPPGRKPIQTIQRTENFRPKIMTFIQSEIALGRQIYMVYPLIDESEKLDFESLMAGYEQVKAWFPYPQYRVAMVHGKQPVDEKDRNMQRFVKGEANILVATTVIEVGVNVPNASVMVIESAERFGLSQLHQLRGRVGRGAEKSYCVLLTASNISKESRQRMDIMVSTTDGFVIAEEDLRMRGPGDIYGTRQSGALNFKIADILEDGAIIAITKEVAERILTKHPDLDHPELSALKKILQSTSSPFRQSWDKIS